MGNVKENWEFISVTPEAMRVKEILRGTVKHQQSGLKSAKILI